MRYKSKKEGPATADGALQMARGQPISVVANCAVATFSYLMATEVRDNCLLECGPWLIPAQAPS